MCYNLHIEVVAFGMDFLISHGVRVCNTLYADNNKFFI